MIYELWDAETPNLVEAFEAEDEALAAVRDLVVVNATVYLTIRADSSLARVGVVVISANGLDSDAQAAYAAGADRFLAKPFSP